MQQVSSKPLCTIGIPAYNEEKTLPSVLATLDEQELPENWEFHLFVIANGCTDATVEVALTFGRQREYTLDAEESDSTAHWWHFRGAKYRYSVCEVSVASRNYALNLIHKNSQGDIILLFDADVRVGAGVVKAMCQAMQDHPEYGAVASNFKGEIARRHADESWLAATCRIWISRAMNNFDRFGVRVDGRGYGYRRGLISEHPDVIAVDLWLECVSWKLTKGCIYLRDVYVTYRFPAIFTEFIIQHKRYSKTIADFSTAYPHDLAFIYQQRRKVQQKFRSPYVWYRCIGWLFFTWLSIRTRKSTYLTGEPWEVIRSTKLG